MVYLELLPSLPMYLNAHLSKIIPINLSASTLKDYFQITKLSLHIIAKTIMLNYLQFWNL